jgi:hypothetical protein
VVVAVVVLAGCAGGVPASEPAGLPSEPLRARTAATALPTASPRPPAGGVVATGPEGAFRALERAAHDLFAHPDPARLDDLVVPGTRLSGDWHRRLERLGRAGRSERQPGSTIVDVAVATDTPEVVYLRATYRDTVHETLDRTGRVIASVAMASPSHWVVVLQRDRPRGAARWRFVAIDRAVSDLEVVL